MSPQPPRPAFTPLQGQYLSFIATYERLHGRAPAEADLQRYFGVTPPTVHQMILRRTPTLGPDRRTVRRVPHTGAADWSTRRRLYVSI